tara:strand:+ start:544 stop:744 length:201 start_codon:yes stop_codon:yes gene_type:complete
MLDKEVNARIDLLLKQQETTKNYLVDRLREEDWQSVTTASVQLHSINQELDSLQFIADKLLENGYE